MKALTVIILVIGIVGRVFSQKYDGHDILLKVDTL